MRNKCLGAATRLTRLTLCRTALSVSLSSRSLARLLHARSRSAMHSILPSSDGWRTFLAFERCAARTDIWGEQKRERDVDYSVLSPDGVVVFAYVGETQPVNSGRMLQRRRRTKIIPGGSARVHAESAVSPPPRESRGRPFKG